MAIKPSQYKILKPFEAWIQQTLPAIYDDSLSYTDLLAKLLYYVNTLAENNTTLSNDVTNAINYINNYFNNIDVQDEINKKLDEMVEDGTMDAILGPYLIPYIMPEMYGAKGDGTTDDTNALQQAIEKAVETKKDLVLQTKTYLTTQPLQIQDKFTMRGISYADEYHGQTCIKNNSTNIFVSKTDELEAGIKILNIKFIGTKNFIANTFLTGAKLDIVD